MTSRAAVQLDHLSAKDRQDIDRQLERVLEHPLFHQSKRLPVFLRYIVEESLKGSGTAKERTLGVEVFGRKPDYDSNSDPIVRVTAAELRKKLAQYYYEDGHDGEIRIELTPGSYQPKFRRLLEERNAAAEQAQVLDSAPPNLIVPATKMPIGISKYNLEIKAHPDHHRAPWRVIVAVLCVFLFVVTGLVVERILSRPGASLDKFWAQIAVNSNRVFIVMPVIGSDNIKGADTQLRSISVLPSLSLEDTDVATRVASQLERHGGRYQLVSSSEIGLNQLQTDPSVLIGALDNVWTMRLMQNLPFVFEGTPDHRTGHIVSHGSGGTTWTVNIDMPHTRISKDYGIVARYTNRLTGQPVVVVAGISSQGTQAAGELLTTSEFESIRAIAEKSANFEVIIETEAIDGHAGRPQIIGSRTW
jgi:hypothetical protein